MLNALSFVGFKTCTVYIRVCSLAVFLYIFLEFLGAFCCFSCCRHLLIRGTVRGGWLDPLDGHWADFNQSDQQWKQASVNPNSCWKPVERRGENIQRHSCSSFIITDAVAAMLTSRRAAIVGFKRTLASIVYSVGCNGWNLCVFGSLIGFNIHYNFYLYHLN